MITLLVFHALCNISFVFTHGVAVIEQRRIGDKKDEEAKAEEEKAEKDNAPPEIGTVEWAKQ